MDEKPLNQRRQQPEPAAGESESWAALAGQLGKRTEISAANPVHHKLRLHGLGRQRSARHRRISGYDSLRRRDPRLHPEGPRPYINVGTLTPDWLPAMKKTAAVANESKKPWVLDPVAAGASGFRLKACLDLLKLRPTVVRGNGSEILSLFKGSEDKHSKGVDSTHESTDAIGAAKSLARIYGCIVAVSGAVDIVTDGERVVGAKNGVPLLQQIAATGCAVTAVITALVAVNPSLPLEAAASALSIFGVASELGMGSARGPASLRMHLIDELHGLNEAVVLQSVNISNI